MSHSTQGRVGGPLRRSLGRKLPVVTACALSVLLPGCTLFDKPAGRIVLLVAVPAALLVGLLIWLARRGRGQEGDRRRPDADD